MSCTVSDGFKPISYSSVNCLVKSSQQPVPRSDGFKPISYSSVNCLVKSSQQPVPSLGSEAVKRVYIPKPGNDKKRPLGIPAYEDKIVQDVMTQIFEICSIF